jgi:hypothetical protein
MILHWKFHQKDHLHEFPVVNNAHLYIEVTFLPYPN